VGQETRVLVDGASRHGGLQVSGRDPHQRVVNLDPGPGEVLLPGDFVEARIVEAQPHSLRGVSIGSRLKSSRARADEGETVERAGEIAGGP
jgi:tRNA A37 methylthiotransferase MiaB